MEFLYLVIFLSSAWISVSASNNCTVTSAGVLNCTGLKWTDCPENDNSIRTLILDFNLLTTLNTNMCKQWTQLTQLFIRNNPLETTSDFSEFISLTNLDLSRNKLTKVNINAIFVLTIDVSFNRLTNMDVGDLARLSVLNISNNNFNKEGMQKLLNSLHLSTKISVFDLSNNGLTELPPKFMTFTLLKMSLLNISANKLSIIDFMNFNKIKGTKFSLDLSNNRITNCTIPKKHTIYSIDLSHNLLPQIQGKHLKNIDGLTQIDLSYNPLRCLCNESEDFINWVKQNSKLLQHPKQTKCKESLPPADQEILNIVCNSSTTSVAPPTGSTTTRPFTSPGTAKTTTSTSNSSFTTEESHVESNSMKITAGVLCTILILVLIGCGVYFFWYRRRPDYIALNGSQTSIGHMPTCDCLPMIQIRNQRNRNIIIDPEENNHNIFTEDRLSIVDSLNILCTSKDTNWLKENITGYLELKVEIIDTSVFQLPYSDFTLIFINGDSSVKDKDLLNNVKLLLQEIDKSEIRLMFNKMPDFSKLSPKNTNQLTDFIKRNVRKNSPYFNWDSDNKAHCLLDLKRWLHSNNDRQNV